jgi:hypothetical protein
MKMNQWISVKERLPKIGLSVDLWIIGDAFFVTFYDTSVPKKATAGRTTNFKWDGERWVTSGGLRLYLSPDVTPTHWMPLPDPPVEAQ